MALDDGSASSTPSPSLPSPPTSTISSSSCTDTSSEASSSVGAAPVDVAESDGFGIGNGRSDGGTGEGGEEGVSGAKVDSTKSATLEGRKQQQSDLEAGDTKGEAKGWGAGLEPSSSLSSSSSSSRRFRWWGRQRTRSWPAVLSDAEEGGKWEGGWGETNREAKEREEAGEGGDQSPEIRPSISVLSSLQSSMQSIAWRIEARLYQMPKWQYRLMVSSIIFLLVSLALLLFVSVVYGFGMSLPHIQVVDIQIVSPLPADGSIPIRAIMRVNNPNRFSITARSTSISIHTQPSRSSETKLGTAAIPELYLGPHDANHTSETVFVVHDVNSIEGGKDIVKAVLASKATYLYTRTVAELSLMSLGYMSIGRHYISECTILKHWGEKLLLSDCYGRFIRS